MSNGVAALTVIALVIVYLIAVIYLANMAWSATTWFDLIKPLVVAAILGVASFGGNKK